jgi:hypothetical protein
MYFVRISEQTGTFAWCFINRLVFITEMESVYCAVRTEYLHPSRVSPYITVRVHVYINIFASGFIKKGRQI